VKNPVACLVLLFDGSHEVRSIPEILCKLLSKVAGFFFEVKPVQQKRRVRTADQQVSARQRSILKMIGDPLTNAQIGRELNLSESTVRQETIKIHSVLNADGRVDAVEKARAHGWI
jgi:DNA-binding NarL/FixJ family response regulator